ncbi:MAG TPA: hypothetical protein VIZ86_16630 [Pseudomonas sp.]
MIRPQAERLTTIARRREVIASLLAVPAGSILLALIFTFPLWS